MRAHANKEDTEQPPKYNSRDTAPVEARAPRGEAATWRLLKAAHCAKPDACAAGKKDACTAVKKDASAAVKKDARFATATSSAPNGSNATSSTTDAGQKCRDTKETSKKLKASILSLSLSFSPLSAVDCLQLLRAAMAG